MTKIGRELGRKGITVNAVAPGFVRTDMTAAMPEAALAAVEAKIPIGVWPKLAKSPMPACFLPPTKPARMGMSWRSMGA